MIASAFFDLVAWLYYLCFLLLVALSLYIATQGRWRADGQRTHHRARLRRTFLWLALSLLLWQLTLFLEVRTVLPVAQLWLGRLNFTAIAFAPYLSLRFVQEVSARDSRTVSRWIFWLRAETAILSALTLLTPLVSAAERVESGHAITTFGPFFPCYLIHVVGCLMAAVVVAWRERRRAGNRRVRRQLTLISAGMLTTGGIALITNALLPYVWGDFRWGDIGTLSTLCFVLTIAYATFVYRLFDLRVVLRETLVYGILLAFVLGAYSSTVFVVSQYLTEGAGKLTQFAVLLIAFSFDPLRRFLEEKADGLLFGARKDPGEDKKRQGRRAGSRFLAILFPWRSR